VAAWARRFLFRSEQLAMPVGKLSGGEQARVLLAGLMLQPADVLVLDEPTRTASRRCGLPTTSSCSRRAPSSKKAPMHSCLNGMGNMPGYSVCRHRVTSKPV